MHARTNEHTARPLQLPRHVTVIGAAGGLGQGILAVCRLEGIGVTAVVRSRPERVSALPSGSRVVVVESLANWAALASACSGSDAVLTATGVTSRSSDPTALLSANMLAVEQGMAAANVDRIILINTLLASRPGQPAGRIVAVAKWMPGMIGRGVREQQAVVDALGRGACASLRWTLVRAGLHARGANEQPAASTDWGAAVNSWKPVSYTAMGRWMLEEAVANRFVRAAPLVSRRRR